MEWKQGHNSKCKDYQVQVRERDEMFKTVRNWFGEVDDKVRIDNKA